MDLLQTVRKEGSRGGRGEFKWEDVKNDAHRENYLGHSVMAPVGRWQKNKDLSWYAKSDADGKQLSEAEARKEEIRKIKEAESDALARALGYDVPTRSSDNPNLTALGDRGLQKTINDSFDDDEGQDSGKGIGYGRYGGAATHGDTQEVLEGVGLDEKPAKSRRHDHDGEHHREKKEDRGRRRRRSKDREREHGEHRRRRREGSRERGRRREPRSRSRSSHRKRDRDERRHRSRDRRSPHESRDHDRGRHHRRSRSRSPNRDRYDEQRGRRR